jgi:hypothetical protein
LKHKINKLAELLGISKLDESSQDTATTLLEDLITETGDPIKNFGLLIKSLGADILPGEVQQKLIEKIGAAVVFIRENTPISKDTVMQIKDFKWDSTATSVPGVINETVKKEKFKWSKDGETVGTDGTHDVMKAKDFRWAQPNAYGALQEGL